MLKKTILLLTLAITFQSMAHNSDTPITQTDMNQSSSKDYQAAKKSLNETYEKVLKASENKNKILFKKSQNAWEKYRDSYCDYSSSGVQGGSTHSMVYAACLTEKTEQRKTELENFLTCPEGDLSCPFANPAP